MRFRAKLSPPPRRVPARTNFPCSSSRSYAGNFERQFIAVQSGADRLLVVLARRAERDLVDEQHVVGHPPSRDLAVEEGFEVVGRGFVVLLELTQQDRPLVPFGKIGRASCRERMCQYV